MHFCAMESNKEMRLAIFASGAGSNAEKILEYFAGSHSVHIALIVHNKPGIGVIDIAKRFQVPTLLIDKERFFRGDSYLPILKECHIDMIILAGFLWKIPAALIAAYPQRIINIHPALLPAYGGKGMYGAHVHQAVMANKEPQSGITIHLVDEKYDNGAHLFQATCDIAPEDTPESLAAKVHLLEHQYFPKVIEKYIRNIQDNPY